MLNYVLLLKPSTFCVFSHGVAEVKLYKLELSKNYEFASCNYVNENVNTQNLEIMVIPTAHKRTLSMVRLNFMLTSNFIFKVFATSFSLIL